MAILTDREIEELVKNGKLISEKFNPRSLTPNGYDITIGSVRLGQQETQEKVSVGPMKHFLVSSKEFFNFPEDVVGQIWIRSSYARRGIIGSFGFIDAGFRGNLTLSFFNSSDGQVEFVPGDRIAQLVFSKLENSVAKSYGERSGSYQDSRGVTLASPEKRLSRK